MALLLIAETEDRLQIRAGGIILNKRNIIENNNLVNGLTGFVCPLTMEKQNIGLQPQRFYRMFL